MRKQKIILRKTFKGIRKEAGFPTQKSLADKLGISQQMMYMMESRRCSVSATNLMKLPSILGVDIDKIVRVISLTETDMSDEENTQPEGAEQAPQEPEAKAEGQGEDQVGAEPAVAGDEPATDGEASDSDTPEGEPQGSDEPEA